MFGIVIGSLIAIAFFAWFGWYFFGQIANGRPLRLPVRIGLAIALLAGAWLTWANAGGLLRAYQRIAWPKAEGTITDAIVLDEFYSWHIEGEDPVRTKLPESPELHDTAERYQRLNLRPRITFSWQVNGQSYSKQTDLGAPGFGGKMNRRDLALKLLKQHTKGSTVDVHYNPTAPEEGYLRPGPHWELFGRLSFGVLLLGMGIGGLLVRPSPPPPDAD